MAKTWASLFSLLIILSLTSLGVQAQDGNRTVLYSEEVQTYGPVWLSVSCLEVSCGMELIIWHGGLEYRHQDSHNVEWAGYVQGNFSWELVVDEGINGGDLQFESVQTPPVSVPSLTEHEDLVDNVPSPGIQGEYVSIDTYSNLNGAMNNSDINIYAGLYYVGALSDPSDKDAVMIVGNPGDVMLLEQHTSANDSVIEIWRRTNQSKSLMDTKEGLGSHYFEYPSEGELWLRVVHSSESDYSPYSFEIGRYDSDIEAPGGGELSNPWSHGNPMPFEQSYSYSYRGSIAASDSQGDSILIASGPKMWIEADCDFRGGIVSVNIILHHGDGTQVPTSYGCEETVGAASPTEIIETTPQTISIEFRFTTQGTNAVWSMGLRKISKSDGSLLGDAPDVIWEHNNIDTRWQVLNLEAVMITGMLASNTWEFGPQDTTDYYAFSVTEKNGSYVRIQRYPDSPGLFTLMTLDQETGEVVNSTNGSMMIVPPGIHAVRVQWEESMGEGSREYQFSLPYNGPYVPQEEEFVDLSHRAQPFYIFAGFLLLTPLVMVIWWNRDAIFRGAPLAADIQEHERRRLRSLRQRLSAALISEDIDQVEIEHSLKQLRESPWKAVVEDWGEPVIRHLTEKVEICVWRVSDSKSDLLIGIRVEKFPWELAAIGVHAAEGSAIDIKSVSPSRLYQDGEVFLDTLSAGSKTFVGIELDGSSTTIGFHLSGLVDGAPLAAIPNKSLEW